MPSHELENEAPRPRARVIIAILSLTAAIVALLSLSGRPVTRSAATGTAGAPTAPVQPLPTADNWKYSSTTAEMTGEKQDVACTTSSEKAQLCFRKTGLQLESYLSFPADDQQFLCTKFHCTTQIKIDDQPVFSLSGSESPDGNIALLYLDNPQQLLKALRGAAHVELGPPMFEGDGLVLHFHVGGLDHFAVDHAVDETSPSNHVTEGHDPRLTAPITPVFPPRPGARKEPAPENLRLGEA